MTEDELTTYLANATSAQAEGVRAIRSLILSHEPGIRERVIDEKWLAGLIGYTTPDGDQLYALGLRGRDRVSFHAFPYYCSSVLQQRHAAILKPFLTGKSCLEFRQLADLPMGAISDIVGSGSQAVAAAKAAYASRRR